MSWEKSEERETSSSQYFRILIKIRATDFDNSKYRVLGMILGGETFIKQKIGEMLIAIREQDSENIPELKRVLAMALFALRSFSEETGLHPETPDPKMLREFIAGSEIDEHAMFRILAYALYSLSIELYILGKKLPTA